MFPEDADRMENIAYPDWSSLIWIETILTEMKLTWLKWNQTDWNETKLTEMKPEKQIRCVLDYVWR